MIWSAWLRRRRWEQRLDAELRFHIEQQITDYINTGLPPDEARKRAYQEFGAMELTKDECRDQRPIAWLGDIAEDARYAIRIFSRSPVFTLVALFTLALGIGANTAMFTLIHHVLLKTLPVSNPEQLVELGCINTNQPDKVGCGTTYPGFLLFHETNQTLDGIFAFASTSALNVAYGGAAELASGLLVSGDAFSVLGISPYRGRLLNPADDAASASPAAVLSYGYWQRRFGGDSRIIGKALRVNTHLVTIIGVAPQSFHGVTLEPTPDLMLSMGSGADLFYGKGSLQSRGNQWLRMIGRRKDGVTLGQVQVAFEPVFRRAIDQLVASIPAGSAARAEAYFRGVYFRALPAAVGAASEFRRDLDRPLQILMAVVSLVLLIACANLTGLFLARSAGRRREFGVRLALGATRSRLARQLFTETLILSTMGGLLGLLIAYWSGPILLKLASGEMGLRAVDLTPDVSVLTFTFAVALLTGILLSIGPILQLAKAAPQNGLQEGRGTHTSLRISRLLVPTQVAVATIVLVGAGLLLRTFEKLLHIDLGFRSEKLITLQVTPGLVGYNAGQTRVYLDTLTGRLESLPGVQSVTISNEPMASLGSMSMVEVPGFESALPMERAVGRNHVGSRFIETIGLKLLRGRDFMAADSQSSRRIAIINESFARHFFRTPDVVNRQFTFSGEEQSPFLIVGVVADALDGGPRRPARRVVYTPYQQAGFDRAAVALRVQDSGPRLVESIRSVLKEVDAAVPLQSIRTVDAQIGEALRREKLLALLGSVFGGLALLLVAIGLYGLLSGAVIRRTNEIGIRMALGARQRNVLWLFMREGLALVSLGLAVGLAGALLLARLMRGLLFGIMPDDPATFGSAAMVLVVVAIGASLLPSLRASRTEPASALRRD